MQTLDTLTSVVSIIFVVVVKSLATLLATPVSYLPAASAAVERTEEILSAV